MSFGERFDTDLADSDTDKKNPNVITRCQSMMVNEDQYSENWTKIRETSSLPITHNGFNRAQGKSSFHMAVEVEQQDLETSLRRVWST